jgi:ATP-dependent Clp protease ATP-binding subunit ClpA
MGQAEDMFERFTGRARRVVVRAQEEARLLNHNYIGTEHILLGLLGEPESIAGTVLESFGITRDGVRVEVEEKIGRGKSQPSGHIPFTPRAKKTLELSLREALQIKHNYIGTEHILLGLIREGDGVATQILREHADLLDIRAAVLNTVPAVDPGEPVEGSTETNAALRWLRHRLGRRGSTISLGPEALGAESVTRGTPAVEAALQQAAVLAGSLPVGSHHLLLAALDDANSAASGALATLGVNLDELREKLRSAQVAGTSDEQPEQAGRRQMTIEVADDKLSIVLTDPVIVAAGQEALRVVNAKAAAPSAAKGDDSADEATAGEGTDSEAGAEGTDSEGTPSTVIRGDLPLAANLASVWLELRDTLGILAETTSPAAPVARRIRVARKLPDTPPPGESGEPEAATS